MTIVDPNPDASRLITGIVRVGDGRGFVVRCQNYHGHEELVVITAAHCLPHFPPPHPAMYLEERTYQRILGPLGRGRVVWAECLFADPMADIAVLGSPDDQALYDKAEFYRRLVASAHPFTVADAPAQGIECVTLCRRQRDRVSYTGRGYCASAFARWSLA
jgi:hypothetical protein